MIFNAPKMRNLNSNVLKKLKLDIKNISETDDSGLKVSKK